MTFKTALIKKVSLQEGEAFFFFLSIFSVNVGQQNLLNQCKYVPIISITQLLNIVLKQANTQLRYLAEDFGNGFGCSSPRVENSRLTTWSWLTAEPAYLILATSSSTAPCEHVNFIFSTNL